MEAPISPVGNPKKQAISQSNLPSPSSKASDIDRIKPLIVEPARNSTITAHDFSGATLEFKWLLEGGSAPANWKLLAKESGKTLHEGTSPALAQSSQTVHLVSPGKYEFVIQVGKNRASTEFTLDSKVELPRPKSARLSKEAPKFEFDLPPNLPAGVKNLRLELFRYERDETPTLVRELATSSESGSLEIPADEIGKLSFFRWAIYPEEASGKDTFLGMSPKTQILAELPAPTLTSPEPAIELPAKSAAGDALNIVFTWMRVPLSEEYVLEISKTPEFKSTEKSARTEANYMYFALNEAGHYWWRVRCDSERAPGLWSQPREFTVITNP
jgi:hypothetical protein